MSSSREGFPERNSPKTITIEEDVIEAISFHLLEGDLRLADGRTLEATLEEPDFVDWLLTL